MSPSNNDFRYYKDITSEVMEFEKEQEKKERREKKIEKIAEIICDYDIELANSHELAEEIMKEIDKEE
jgi:hypothetical protein